jgi:hypothetical protein
VGVPVAVECPTATRSHAAGNGRTATSSSNGSSSLAARQQLVEPPAPMQHTKVLSEEVIYQRYITVYQRRVQFSSPSAAEVGCCSSRQT